MGRVGGADFDSITEVAIEELEVAAAGCWQAPEQERLGGWRLRAAAGFTGRANSALPTGDPGRPLPAAVEAVRAWYRARGLPPMISVPFPMAGPEGSEVDRYLDEQGWPVRNSAAIVMTAPPDLIAGAAGGPAAGPAGGTAESTAMTLAAMTLAAEPDEDWLARYHYRGTVLPPIARRLLLSAPWQAFGSVRADGQTIAIGRVAAAGGWAGLTAIEVDPGHRRRGLGRAVTAALAAAAADRGLTGLYLQVEAENTVARSLYHRLGFTDHHRYHYRVAPAG
jgi:GNAT superfamily N-acetyltransferase